MSRLATVAALSLIATAIPLVGAAGSEPKERVIVVLEQGSILPEVAAEQAAAATGGRILYVYQHAIAGFALDVPTSAVPSLERRPGVAWVEPDVVVSIAQTAGLQPTPSHIDRVEADLNPPAPIPGDVDIAIIDTGVWISHSDLNLRYVTDCTGAIFYPTFGGCDGGGNTQDENGHGTHVAGLAAACDNEIGTLGTAPCATLTSVKVLDASGSGYLGGILAGLDLVAANASWLDVANASWGFEGGSDALDASVSGVIDAGVVFVAAAGNSAKDISTFSPASHPDAITVTALADFDGLPGGHGDPTCRTDVDDTLADFSNFGAGADIAAPGVCLFSTWLNDGYNTISGTSMAAPVVTGAVARYIAENGKPTGRDGVLAIRDALVAGGFDQTGPCGFTDVSDGHAEPLLSLTGPAFGGSGSCQSGPIENQPPVAAFTHICDGLTCDFTSTSTDEGPISHAWDFGNEATSTDVSPSHTFSQSGTYDVILVVTDEDGLTDETSTTIDVSYPVANQPPTASFTSSCPDLRCSFDAAGSDDPDGTITAYRWDFGDGSSATGVESAHAYAISGDYPVTLTVTDDDGANAAVTQTVTVTNGTPVASFTHDCSGLTCDFDASGSSDDGGIVSYAWDFGDGTTATGITASHGYATAGNHMVTLTVVDAEGAGDSGSAVVSVTEPSDIEMTTGNPGFLWDEATRRATIQFLITTVDLVNPQPVPGAVLTGDWTVVNKGGRESAITVSGTADGNGLVTIVTSFKKNEIPVEFCVTDLTKDGYVWAPSGLECGTMVPSEALLARIG